jgi:bifunctional non-homologous end joining protein LigD
LGKKSRSSSGLVFSHLNKIFWPKEKYTKGDVIEYYRKAAPMILPYLKDRPESLNRHPDGIASPSFYQRNVGRESLPPFIKTCRAAIPGNATVRVMDLGLMGCQPVEHGHRH